MTLPDLTLCNADVLFPDGVQRADLSISAGKIVNSGGRRIDLSGFLILPGIVDIHGDAFEWHLAPRRGALKDRAQGMRMAAAELAVNGITTAVMAQFYSWEGGMRSPEAATLMADALAEIAPRVGTDLRLQLRFETHMLEDYAAFEAMVDQTGCRYVVFNDHIPHDRLAAGRKPPRLTGTALKSGRSPEAHLALMQRLHDGRDAVPAAVGALAQRPAAKGVRLGSHDDATPEQRAFWRAQGVLISEFPETEDTARAACEAGDQVILGGPNVLRGGSHKGNANATNLIRAGLCDALASDYHYPAPRIAALRLAQEIGLDRAWALVSSGPARLLGLSDRGHIAPGLRADLVIVAPNTGDVGATIADGQITHAAGPIASRLIGA